MAPFIVRLKRWIKARRGKSGGSAVAGVHGAISDAEPLPALRKSKGKAAKRRAEKAAATANGNPSASGSAGNANAAASGGSAFSWDNFAFDTEAILRAAFPEL